MTQPPNDPPDSAGSARPPPDGFTPRLIACRARALNALLESGTVLEFGCADGSLTRELAQHHKHVVAVDPNPRSVESAKQKTARLNVEVHTSALTDFEPPRGMRFNSVILACILDYVDDPVKVLSTAARWLADRGSLVAIVAHSRSVHRLAEVHIGLLSDLDSPDREEVAHEVKRVYTIEKLRADFDSARLRVRLTGGIMFKPLPNSKMHELPKEYVDAYEALGNELPDLAAEIYAVGVLR